jgi:hypothetical protein
MANGVSNLSDNDEFGGSTNVMESGLLRVLKQTSKKSSDTGGWRAIADEIDVGAPAVAPPATVAPPAAVTPPTAVAASAPVAPPAIVAAPAIVGPPLPVAEATPVAAAAPVAEPAEPDLIELEPEPDEPAPDLPPLVVERSERPEPAMSRTIDRTTVVAVPTRRRSRVMLVAGVVAGVVLVADASMYLLHRRNLARHAAAPPPAPAPAAATATKMPAYMVLPEHPVWPQPAPERPAAAAVADPAATPSDAPAATRSHHHHHHHSKH